jgi:hypothetical protein
VPEIQVARCQKSSRAEEDDPGRLHTQGRRAVQSLGRIDLVTKLIGPTNYFSWQRVRQQNKTAADREGRAAASCKENAREVPTHEEFSTEVP